MKPFWPGRMGCDCPWVYLLFDVSWGMPTRARYCSSVSPP